ncbi:hypothetical protein [Jeotgalibacillus proteolyticus]|uniref:hypothetical protein n=1 Tax=Jeotgalibacillus proteolyticus TaxID=2082395 RepID=UPI003CE9E774
MEESQRELREIKKLKKKRLVQYNLAMLLIIVLVVYFDINVFSPFITGIILGLMVIYVAISIYTLVTGRVFGTKTSKRLEEFDKRHWGKKRWKQNRLAQILIISVLGVIISVFFFSTDFNHERYDAPISPGPFIGVWIGVNIGMILQINKIGVPEK